MNLGAPLRDVAPGVRGALLQTLARLEQPVTRRQLATNAGATPGHASSVIDALIATGLVTEVRGSGSSMVSLNRRHLAAGPIVALAGLRRELIRLLREDFSEWPGLDGAWLFGSVARGDAEGDSDVDVLLVTIQLESSDFHERVNRIQSNVTAWTGNDLQFVEHTPTSWRKLVRAGNPLVGQIRLDGIALKTNDPSLLERQR